MITKIFNKRCNGLTTRECLEELALPAFVVSWFLFIGYVGVLALIPATFWFGYESVEPAKPEFEINEPLNMVSNSYVRRKVNFEWLDTLRCQYEGEDNVILVSQYESKLDNAKPKSLATTTWTYGATLPIRPAECFVESHIEVQVGPWIIKEQDVVSGKFKIK